jgi:hypothetical protein
VFILCCKLYQKVCNVNRIQTYRHMAGAGAKSGSSGTRKRRKISQISVHRNLILMGIDLCLSHVFTSKVWCSKQCREQQNDAQIHQKFLVCRGFRRVTAPRNFFSRFSGSFRFVPVRSGSFRCMISRVSGSFRRVLL